ncbi:DUF2075 domain-containing protein [Streptomyces sp. AJ-1]|uniref:DNA/RNA helicase domain-containing protein n=1 Tax=Streptomyces sp. AJ-1 TaxID=3044384 RepID=UPI00249B4918|nr:DNA/RNA helicase domain-containing protein [Streptomyces sp. AJ-1]MDI3347473.1 DUF2075 domain-containing protein [Streptomyces sp. AJ-1]
MTDRLAHDGTPAPSSAVASRKAAPEATVACVASGRVGELAEKAGSASFIQACEARYTSAGFGSPGEAEVRSWRKSWPPLFEALVRAGLSGLQVYLEYGTPGGSRRLDALIVGARPDGGLGLVVVELKQWQTCHVVDAFRVRRTDGLLTAHPVHQVAAYRSFFQQWRPADAPELDVRGVVLLHNATAVEGGLLSGAVREDVGIPVLTATHLAGRADALPGLLRCEDLVAPGPEQVASFENIRWEPSARLLDRVGAELEGNGTFALVGKQQDALLNILAAASHVLPARSGDAGGGGDGKGAVITVSGGPGSGKTVLAVRLLGRLMRAHPTARPRFVTPSGTLRSHLHDALSAHPAARELFPPASSLRGTARQTGALVIDEAQRLERSSDHEVPPALVSVVEQVPLAVIFLDERQVIRPHEGTTVAEISAVARRAGRTHRHLELDASFRCTGAAYTGWVDALLYGTPLPWTGHADYDLSLVRDPFQLESWIDGATTAGHTARTTAGFCWPWTRTRPGARLPLDIAIDVSGAHAGADERTWRAAWNAAHTLTDPDGRVLAPQSQLWATHEGGHRQIGCVYTAQGLEYHHAGVIIGPDLTWTEGRWHAHPERSRDSRLRSLPAEQYLRYALNTYRVLLTRGTHATRIHATDSATQDFLHRLIGHAPQENPQDGVSAGRKPEADHG